MVLNLRDLAESTDRRESDYCNQLATVCKPLPVPIKTFHNGYQRIELFTTEEIADYEAGYLDAICISQPSSESVEYRLGYLECLVNSNR